MIIKRDIVELQFATDVCEHVRIRFFDDVWWQVNDLKDALETHHGRGKISGRTRETLQRAIELTEI